MIILYVLLTLILLSIMVVIHELGHFIFAKLFKVTVLEFSIGMGPAIFTTKKRIKKNKVDSGFELSSEYRSDEVNPDNNAEVKSDRETSSSSDDAPQIPEKTVFSIRAFPIGGYVSMAGEDGSSDDVNAFSNKKAWQKLVITLAGPVMNILLGIICMFTLVGIEAVKDGRLASTVVAEFKTENADGSPYESISDKGAEPLMPNDKIIKVNNVYVFTGQELVYEITNQGYEPVDLVVERNGERITLHDVSFPTIETQGVTLGEEDFKIYAERPSFKNIMKHAFFRSFSTVKMFFDSIVDMIGGRYGLDAVSGPVGVAGVVGQATQAGFSTLLYLFTIITMNLAVFNLLPFPALDGGNIIFHLYQLITGKCVKKEVEQAINTVGIMLLMALALFITVRDILNLF